MERRPIGMETDSNRKCKYRWSKLTIQPIKQSLGTWSSGLLLALRSLTRTRDPNAARLEYESCALAETTLAAGLKRFILSHGQELV